MSRAIRVVDDEGRVYRSSTRHTNIDVRSDASPRMVWHCTHKTSGTQDKPNAHPEIDWHEDSDSKDGADREKIKGHLEEVEKLQEIL